MEVTTQKGITDEEIHYRKAKKKARMIRDFYINLSLYCFLIPVIIGINLIFVPEFHWFWFSITGWGIGLTIHGLTAFEGFPFMNSNWEERKIQQFIKEDLEREKLRTNFKNE